MYFFPILKLKTCTGIFIVYNYIQFVFIFQTPVYDQSLLNNISLTSLTNAWLCLFTDIDECADKAMCHGGTCVNEPGSYRCACPDGLELSTDGTTCVGKWYSAGCYALPSIDTHNYSVFWLTVVS